MRSIINISEVKLGENERLNLSKMEKGGSCKADKELPAEDNSNIFTMLLTTLIDIFTRITEFFQKLFK